MKNVAIERLVFLDESAAKTNMTRTHGRAPKGVRIIDKVPAGHWKVTTMISAVRSTGPCASAVVSGATDGDVFRTYVQHVLVPELKTGDVVILDNLQPHKSREVKDLIERAGATLLFLPPYSPDFNPIENMWSKVKSILRSVAARTFDDLQEAIDLALSRITPEDCLGFFRHCGYHATRKGALL